MPGLNSAEKNLTSLRPQKKLAFLQFLDNQINYVPHSSSPVSSLSAFFVLTENIWQILSNSSHSQLQTGETFHDQPTFTLRELRNSIFSLFQNKALGPDNVYHRMVRAIFNFSPPLLLDIYNSYLT